MKEFSLQTSKRSEFADITGPVKSAVAEAKISEGICIVFVPHTTAAVTINEGADPAVAHDILAGLGKVAPSDSGQYSHNEGNADSHIKASILGSSASIPVQNKSLALGAWQKIFFCEFDGPRQRKFFVSVQGR